MDRLNGLLLVLAGTVAGAYSGLFEPRSRIDDTSAPIPHIAAPGTLKTQLGAATGETVIRKTTAPVARAPIPRVRVFSAAEPLVSAPRPQAWTSFVTPSRQASSQLTSPRPADAVTRAALAADLQRELKRVGCYGGEINGGWTTSTRHAMQLFMDRVNATLPADEPDYILLTLVQNHAGPACGAGCPSGQAETENGRCMPAAIVAHGTRRADHLAARTEPVAPSPASRSKPQSDRLIANARKTEHPLRAPEKLPWLERDAPQEVAAASAEPLPGRMGVGGPMPEAAAPVRPVTASGETFEVPVPRPAIRPPATTAGLPGTEAGPAAIRNSDAESPPRAQRSKSASRAYKRNARYASGFGGKGRRGQPRIGTSRYNVMLSLGGVY